MSVLFVAIGTAIASFAEGAFLGVSIYLASRGIENPLRTKKK